MNISAKLKEYGFLSPQHVTFMKSATAPYIIRSIALPKAPPITNDANNCKKKLVEFLSQIKNTIEIKTATVVKM